MPELTVAEIVKVLESAPRMGLERDLPEGNRYIQLSDTLARKIAQVLRQQIYD